MIKRTRLKLPTFRVGPSVYLFIYVKFGRSADEVLDNVMMRRIANTEPEKSESKAPTKAELFLDRLKPVQFTEGIRVGRGGYNRSDQIRRQL